MEDIHDRVRTWLPRCRKGKMAEASTNEVRASDGLRVKDFQDLLVKLAHVSFFNRSLLMLFRGQDRDYPNSAGQSTLLPEILRPTGELTKAELISRFGELLKTESKLRNARFLGFRAVREDQALLWALLQHYKICPTPLLDATHSLRVACTFSKKGDEKSDTLLYVLGIPHLAGAITTLENEGLQAIRLLSACPPRARRPHFQEGYLLGTHPTMNLEATENYYEDAWDFGRRLVCKLVLPPASQFWSQRYQPLPQDAILPPDDPFEKQAKQVRDAIA